MTIADGLWSLPARSGEGPARDWRFEAGALAGLAIGERRFEAGDPLLSRLDLGFDGEGRAFPPAFRHSPHDGAPLARRAAARLAFSAPTLLPDGFADLGLAGRAPVADLKAPVSLPGGTQSLFAFGEPTLLHALTLQGDLLFEGQDGAWHPMMRLSPPSLAPHAHTVVSWSGGFAAVLGGRLVVARAHPDDPELAIHSPDAEGATPVGGPAILSGREIVFPVALGGALALRIHDIASGAWRTMAVSGGEQAGGAILAAPVQNRSAAPDCHWIGRHGTLVLGSYFGEAVAEYRPHPPGVAAIEGAPPLRDRGGTIHALVETEAHFAWCALTKTPRIERLSGPHLAAGERSYFGRQVFASLWDDDAQVLPVEAGSGRVLLPLAWSEEATGRVEGTLLLLIEDVASVGDLFAPKPERVHRASLHWHTGARVIPLGLSMRIRTRFDVLAVKDGDGLLVGSALDGRFHRWDCR